MVTVMAFAVAQRVRGDIAGLGAANEQLGSTKGLLETTMGALNETSNNLKKMRETLTKLSSDTLSDSDRTTYTKDFENLVNQTNRALGDASYNGRSLLGSQDANASAASTAAVMRSASPDASLPCSARSSPTSVPSTYSDTGRRRSGHL